MGPRPRGWRAWRYSHAFAVFVSLLLVGIVYELYILSLYASVGDQTRVLSRLARSAASQAGTQGSRQSPPGVESQAGEQRTSRHAPGNVVTGGDDLDAAAAAAAAAEAEATLAAGDESAGTRSTNTGIVSKLVTREKCMQSWMSRKAFSNEGVDLTNHRVKFQLCVAPKDDREECVPGTQTFLKLEPKHQVRRKGPGFVQNYILEEVMATLALDGLRQHAPGSRYDAICPHYVGVVAVFDECSIAIPHQWATVNPRHRGSSVCWWVKKDQQCDSRSTAPALPLIGLELENIPWSLPVELRRVTNTAKERVLGPHTGLPSDPTAVRNIFSTLVFQMLFAFTVAEWTIDLEIPDMKADHFMFRYLEPRVEKEVWRYDMGEHVFYADASAAHHVSLELIDFHLAPSMFTAVSNGETAEFLQSSDPAVPLEEWPTSKRKQIINANCVGKSLASLLREVRTMCARKGSTHEEVLGEATEWGTNLNSLIKATRDMTVSGSGRGRDGKKVENAGNRSVRDKIKTMQKKSGVGGDSDNSTNLFGILLRHPFFAEFRQSATAAVPPSRRFGFQSPRDAQQTVARVMQANHPIFSPAYSIIANKEVDPLIQHLQATADERLARMKEETEKKTAVERETLEAQRAQNAARREEMTKAREKARQKKIGVKANTKKKTTQEK